MISEQIDREFTTDDYDGLKKVYSIWIFFDAPEKDSDTITEYAIEKKDIYGPPVDGGKYDYLSISFIRLSKGSMEDSKNKLIHMLSTLFSEQLNAEQKKKILEQEHQMEMTRKLEGRIHTMCNVGAGLWERAEERGLERGGKEHLIQQVKKKLEKNKSAEQIADELEEPVSVISDIMDELKIEEV